MTVQPVHFYMISGILILNLFGFLFKNMIWDWMKNGKKIKQEQTLESDDLNKVISDNNTKNKIYEASRNVEIILEEQKNNEKTFNNFNNVLVKLSENNIEIKNSLNKLVEIDNNVYTEIKNLTNTINLLFAQLIKNK